MASQAEVLENYKQILRDRQIELATKLSKSAGADAISTAVKNASSFAALQGAINAADDILQSLK